MVAAQGRKKQLFASVVGGEADGKGRTASTPRGPACVEKVVKALI